MIEWNEIPTLDFAKKELQISLNAFVSMLKHSRSVFNVNYVAFNNEYNLLLVT